MYPILWKQEPLKTTTGFYTDRRTPGMLPKLDFCIHSPEALLYRARPRTTLGNLNLIGRPEASSVGINLKGNLTPQSRQITSAPKGRYQATPRLQPTLCNRATSKNLGIIDVCDNYILFLLISPKSVK